VHLLTVEALDLYRARLADDGLLAFNVSNRYLALQYVLRDGAKALEPSLACVWKEDLDLSEAEKKDGKAPSLWVVLARRPSDLEPLVRLGGWKPVEGGPADARWTDDFSNLWRVFKWN
jgi:hypothetical protein